LSVASFSRPPESMLWRVEPQASTVGCPRVVREMGKHKHRRERFWIAKQPACRWVTGKWRIFPWLASKAKLKTY